MNWYYVLAYYILWLCVALPLAHLVLPKEFIDGTSGECVFLYTGIFVPPVGLVFLVCLGVAFTVFIMVQPLRTLCMKAKGTRERIIAGEFKIKKPDPSLKNTLLRGSQANDKDQLLRGAGGKQKEP